MNALYKYRYRLLFMTLFSLLAGAGYMVVQMHEQSQAGVAVSSQERLPAADGAQAE